MPGEVVLARFFVFASLEGVAKRRRAAALQGATDSQWLMALREWAG